MVVSVHLNQIPPGDTLHLEGEADPTDLDLESAGVEAVGPLHYSLDVGLSGSGLFATGWLRIRLRMTCVRTLEPFEQDFEVSPFALQKELSGPEEVDLTEEIREDIQLSIPAYPKRPQSTPADLKRRSGEGDERPSTPDRRDLWRALDDLKLNE